MNLIVLTPFEGYAEGARITDEAVLARILEGEARGFVVQMDPLVDDEPDHPAAPAAEPQE